MLININYSRRYYFKKPAELQKILDTEFASNKVFTKIAFMQNEILFDGFYKYEYPLKSVEEFNKPKVTLENPVNSIDDTNTEFIISYNINSKKDIIEANKFDENRYYFYDIKYTENYICKKGYNLNFYEINNIPVPKTCKYEIVLSKCIKKSLFEKNLEYYLTSGIKWTDLYDNGSYITLKGESDFIEIVKYKN